jgi:hypothetical protein
MSNTLVNADSVLAIDVGAVNTRAVLFDVVEGRYRFVASGTAQTTAGAPYGDIVEGVHQALQSLQEITGRTIVGADGALITPGQADGSGVDRCVATLSAGPVLRAVVVGLLEDISVQSAEHLVATIYAHVYEVIRMNDRRKTGDRLDAILRARPDIVVISGGTEGGASHSIQTLLEPVGLACYLLPKEHRPQVLYAGNQALSEEVKSLLGSLVPLQFAPNIRPALDVERLLPAQRSLANVYRQARARQIQGVAELDRWTGGKLMPSAAGFGRTIRFISKEYAKTRKGVLGVDIGASSTTVAASFAGELYLNVYPHMGMGEGMLGTLHSSSLQEITRWLQVDVEDFIVQDYIYNKSLNPASLPVTPEELAIEQALATQAIQSALKKALRTFPEKVVQASGGILPPFEPIITAGRTVTLAPEKGQILMMLLNAFQPAGVTTLALDQNNLSSLLGAAAEVSPLLTIQSLDASNFTNLCTVISPVGKAPAGTTILRLHIRYSEGSETSVDIKNGALEVIELPLGQTVNVKLQPLHRFDVGMGGPGASGSIKILGGVIGLVVDARGRPLSLPDDPARRLDLVQKWHWTVNS